MAGSLNKVMLIGFLGRHPEIRSLNSGDRVANFSLATSESWKDKQSGERKEKTEWHNVAVFNDNLVKLCENYLKKGSKVYIEGQLQTRKWSKNNVDHYSTEIVLKSFVGTITMLDSRKDGEERGGGGSSGNESSGKSSSYDDLDDAIPF